MRWISLKLNIINPNTSKEMTDLIRDIAQRVALPGTEIRCVSPGAGPSAVESCLDDAIAAIGVAEQIRAGHQTNADAHIIACFGDPGLDAARELVSGPVLGIAQAAFQTAQMLADRFAVITSVPKATTVTRHLLHKYGAEKHCAGVWALNIPVLELEKDSQHTFSALREMALVCMNNHEADAIVLGCAGLTDLAEQLSQELGVPVIDGVSVAIGMAEMLVHRRFSTSSRGYYAAVSDTSYSGWAKPLGSH